MKCSSVDCPNPAVAEIRGLEVTRYYCKAHYMELRDAVKDIKNWDCGATGK